MAARPRLNEVLVPVEERGAYLGWMENAPRLNEWAYAVDRAMYLRALGSPVNLSALMVDFLAAPHFVRRYPDDRTAVARAMLPWMEKDLVLDVDVGGRATEPWWVAEQAAKAFVGIVGETTDSELVSELVERLAADLDTVPFLRYAMLAPRRYSAALSEALLTLASDRRAPAPARMKAMEVLQLGATRNRDGYGTALRHASDALVDVLDDPTQDAALRRTVRERLQDIAPHRIAELHRDGRVQVRPVPPAHDISRKTMGMVDEELAASVAVSVDVDGLVEALHGSDADRVLAAIWLAPWVARGDDDYERIAPALAALMFDERTVLLHGSRCAIATNVVWPLQKVMTPPLKRSIPQAEALAAQFLMDQLRIARSHFSQSMVRWVPPIRAAADILGQVLTDRDEQPHARWSALLAHPHARQRDLRLAILRDEGEDGDLRVMAGTMAHREFPADELELLVDRTTTPWTVRPGAPSVPICEPVEQVPWPWLTTALELATQIDCLALAVGSIARRLQLTESNAAQVRSLARGLSDSAVAKLRACCDADPFAPLVADVAASTNAATVLSLRGAPEDIDAVAVGAAHGLWYRELPPLDAVARLMSGTSPDSVGETRLHSDLEPYVAAGFDDGLHPALWARAYVWLARRHVAAGRHDKAQACWQHALALNPNDFDARRATR